jgi:hypothetical protein
LLPINYRKKLGTNSRFTDRSGTNTAGTDTHPLGTTGRGNSDSLQIRQPAATIFIMGVADIITGNRFFSADLTLASHIVLLLLLTDFRKPVSL